MMKRASFTMAYSACYISSNMHYNGTLTGPVVGTVMTNLALERLFDSHKIALKRASVGDRYILEKLKQDGGNLGGEPSGLFFCQKLHAVEMV